MKVCKNTCNKGYVLCHFRKREGQGIEFTESDGEYTPTIPPPPLQSQSRKRRTRTSSRTRASSVPLSVPKKAKVQVLPVIDEKEVASVTQKVGDELADINDSNLQNKTDKFSGVLPNGMLEMCVGLLGGKSPNMRVCEKYTVKILFYSKILP